MIRDILVSKYITNGNYKSRLLYENLGVRDHTFCCINPDASNEARMKTANALRSLVNIPNCGKIYVYERHLLEDDDVVKERKYVLSD